MLLMIPFVNKSARANQFIDPSTFKFYIRV